MFLVDKYKPKLNDNFEINKDIFKKLKTISDDDSVPHIIFHGPEGSGKKTLIYLFLEKMYDSSIHTLNDVLYSVMSSCNYENKVNVKQSKHHIVIEPNQNNSDRYLIQGVLKQYVKRVPLQIFQKNRKFRIILINNIENLSYYTQTALRRMMEIYSDNCRFILWCRSLNKVIDPIISRCLIIRVPSPSDEQVKKQLEYICEQEQIILSDSKLNKIIKKGNGNIKTSIWLLEMEKYGLKDNNVYDDELSDIVELILMCDLKKIDLIREKIYKIIITNISEIKILKDLLNELLEIKFLSDDIKQDIIDIASETDINLIRCRREIIQLESFILKIIHNLKIVHKFDYNKKNNNIKVNIYNSLEKKKKKQKIKHNNKQNNDSKLNVASS